MNLPSYLVKGVRVNFAHDEAAAFGLKEGPLNEAPYHGIVHQDKIWYVAENHPLCVAGNVQRFSQGLIAGQAIANIIEQTVNITMADIAGELGGGAPVIGDDPRKASIIEAAQTVVHAGWQIASQAPAVNEELTHAMAVSGAFSSVAPTELDGGLRLHTVTKLLQATGGIFNRVGGLAFIYTGTSEEGTQFVEPYFMFFNTLQSLGQDVAKSLSEAITGFMKDEAKSFEEWSIRTIGGVADDLRLRLTPSWPEGVSIDPPKPEPQVPQEASNDSTPPSDPPADETSGEVDVAEATAEEVVAAKSPDTDSLPAD